MKTTPFSVAIALDTSGGMEDKLDDAQDAVVHFASQTRETDDVLGVDVQVRVNTIAKDLWNDSHGGARYRFHWRV